MNIKKIASLMLALFSTLFAFTIAIAMARGDHAKPEITPIILCFICVAICLNNIENSDL